MTGGSIDAELNERGREQAAAMAATVAAATALHQVWSSPMARARQTAEHVWAAQAAVHGADGRPPIKVRAFSRACTAHSEPAQNEKAVPGPSHA